MKRPKPIFVHLALTLVALIYGLNYIFLKQITPYPLNPKALLLVRSGGAFLFIWLLCLNSGIKERIRHKMHWLQLFICGVCGASINQLLFFTGISRTSAINASLIVISIPVFVFIISFFWKKEKVTLLKSIGIALGMTGAALIILSSSNSTNKADDSLGDLLILINCVLFAIYLIVVKPLTRYYSPLYVAKWMFFFGTLVNLPICLPSVVATDWSSLSTSGLTILFYLIVIVTSAGYIINTWALKFVNATNVSFYIYLQPLFTGIVSAFLFHEVFTIQKLLSALLIFIGVYLVNKK